MPRHDPPAGAAFLITQVGAHAARAYAERVGSLDLTPPQTGLLWAIAQRPGRSQQELAAHMGTPPTRLVALVDGLEERGLVARRRNPDDRRLYAVDLTPDGEALMTDLARASREHDDAVLAALSAAERAELVRLLGRVAADAGLSAGVHPGYRTLPAGATSSPRRGGKGARGA